MAGMQPELAMEMESVHSSEADDSEEEYDPVLVQEEIEQEQDPERRKQLERKLYGSRYVWRKERVELQAHVNGPVLERIPWSEWIPEFVQFSEDEVVALEKERADLKPLAERPSGPVQEMYLAFVMGGHLRLGSASPLSLLSGTPEMFQEILKLCAPLDIAMRVYNLQYSTSIGNHSPPRETGPRYFGYAYEHMWWRKVLLGALYVHYNQRTVHVVGGYVPEKKREFFNLLHQVMWRQEDADCHAEAHATDAQLAEEEGFEDTHYLAETWMWKEADAGVLAHDEKVAPHAFQRAHAIELDLYRDHKRQLAEILKIITGKKKEGEDAQNNHIIWILNIPDVISAAETRRVRFPATRLYATLKLILQYAAEPYSVVVMKGNSIEDEMINAIVRDVIVTHDAEKPNTELVRINTERFRSSYLSRYWDDGTFKEFTTEAGMWKSNFLRDFMGNCIDVCRTLYTSVEDGSTPTRYWLHCSEETAATQYKC